MNYCRLFSVLGFTALLAQSQVAPHRWKPPRTADGQPDLQGVWANNTATPLERPKELAGRTSLTDQEVAAMKKKAAELYNGGGDAAFGDTIFQTVWAASKAPPWARMKRPPMSSTATQATTARNGSSTENGTTGPRSSPIRRTAGFPR